jgi:hypothetical protein
MTVIQAIYQWVTKIFYGQSELNKEENAELMRHETEQQAEVSILLKVD